MNTDIGDSPERRPFPSLLRFHREAAGLTQEALAERAAMSVRGIKYLEQGARAPQPQSVQRLADALALALPDRTLFQDAARRMKSAPAPPLASREDRTALIGRAMERDLLARHLAGEGSPMLLLAGEPGIGKSRLLEQAAREGRGAGWRVLVGGCQRRDGQEPYAPLLEALESVLCGRQRAGLRADLQGCAWLVRLLPELAALPIEPLPAWEVAPEQERRLMFKAAARFLQNVAGAAGTLLVLDDLQWAGADALDLLGALLGTADARVRAIGAYRDTEVAALGPLAAALADLAKRGLAHQHDLTPLAPEEAEQLAGTLLAGVEGDYAALVAGVLRRAGGNPFFLVSCAQALRHGAASAAAGAVPWDAAQGIRLRVAALPIAAQETLGVAALIGRSVPPSLLVEVIRLSESAALDALDAAVRARLLSDAGEGYEFAHDLIREVVEGGVGPGRRAALHRRIAECLERQAVGTAEAAPAAVLAYHYQRGGARDKAARHLEHAGDQAQAQAALAGAGDYFREAAAVLDGLGQAADAARVREKLAAVLITASQYSAALDLLEQAADTLRTARDLNGLGRVLGKIGSAHAWRGTVAAGIARLEPVLAVFEAREPSAGLVGLHAGLARLYFESGKFRKVLAMHTRAAELARLLGEDGMLAEALVGSGAALVMMGRDPEALPLLDEGSGLAEAAGDLRLLSFALLDKAWIYEERGEFAASETCAARALAMAERLAFPLRVADATLRLGALRFFAGDWVGARAYFERVTGLAEESPAFDAMPPLDRGRLALAEGAWEEATGYLEECSAVARRTGERLKDRAAESLLAEREVLGGNPSAAVARLIPFLDRDGMEERIVTTHVLPVLAWAYLEAGDTPTAAQVIAEAIRRAWAAGYRLALVVALRVRALVALRQGDPGTAAQALEEGLALARPMPYPHGEARLLHVYGLLHQQAGEPVPARERLAAALAIFRRLGAQKDIERVELDLAGIASPA